MKRCGLLFAVMLVFAGVASAQDDMSKFEAFGGYSYVRANTSAFDINQGYNYNGGSGSLAYNVTPWLAGVADFGGYHWSGSGDFAGLDSTVVTYLFGPKVSYRSGRFTPFVQALFGGAHGSFNGFDECSTARVRPQGCPEEGNFSDNAFAMTVGGGLDWNVTQHIGVRLIQAEYLMTRFASTSQNNARISAGVTVRF
jgi:opacity protein-like surface antigen